MVRLTTNTDAAEYTPEALAAIKKLKPKQLVDEVLPVLGKKGD